MSVVPWSAVRIKYWWVGNPYRPSGPQIQAGGVDNTGNPNNRGYTQFRDTDGDGDSRDEYLCKLGEKNSTNITICTDQSRQAPRGWLFFHGGVSIADPNATSSTNVKRNWKNNLYADGHAASVRPDEVQWRWGKSAGAAAAW